MNPYAYLNDLGSYSVILDGETVEVQTTDKIAASRRLLQDPYAYLDDLGGFSAAEDSAHGQPGASHAIPQQAEGRYSFLIANERTKGRHSNAEIEATALDLQRRMWQERDQIWPDGAPSDPIGILDPSIAFKLLGYDFDIEETLGQFFMDGKQIEVAGSIDDSSMQARISRQFQYEVRNFTAAHELGHALLHEARGLHRDRPLDGGTMSREPIEIEADKFATYFLMPAKLVRARFENLFGTGKFILNQDTGFALARGTALDLNRDCRSLRDLSRILAGAESYNGRRFASLARQFRVSIEAMAIRLEELELVAF